MFSALSLRILLFILVVLLFASFMFPYMVELFYPYYYKETIEYYSEQNGVDPLLVASIIRMESKFDALAESKRGARGLMQLMPATASWIAAQLDIEYDKEKLFDPEYNIILGAWYISSLAKEFDNDIYKILAAYNAGRGNVDRWLEAEIWTGSIGDVDSIPYNETREYVKKVDRTYKVYTTLYSK